MEQEAVTFNEFIFNVLHHGQKVHNFRITTKAKREMAEQINAMHEFLMNEAEDDILEELEEAFSEFLPKPEPEEEDVVESEKSEVIVENVDKKESFVQKFRKIFGK